MDIRLIKLTVGLVMKKIKKVARAVNRLYKVIITNLLNLKFERILGDVWFKRY